MKICRTCCYWFSLLALVLSLPLKAEEYKIELLVFSQNTANTELFTQTGSTLSLPENAIDITPAYNADQETLVDIPLSGLNKAAEKIREDSDYAMLLQKSWKQKFTPGQSNPAIRLQDPNGNLNGYISLSEDGTIKAKLDLEYFGSGTAINSNPLVYRLTEKRKLKSGEAQYFDHPKFGAIVLATSLAPPPPPPESPAVNSESTIPGVTPAANTPVTTPVPVVQPTVPTTP